MRHRVSTKVRHHKKPASTDTGLRLEQRIIREEVISRPITRGELAHHKSTRQTMTDGPYLTLHEAAELGRYKSAESLRREIERGTFRLGEHFFNRTGKKGGKILFYRERFLASIEGREAEEINPLDFSKVVNHRRAGK